MALSGGVDSAVATDCLLDQGYEVFGVTMKLQNRGYEEEIEHAREVAACLGISHQVLDLSREFQTAVIEPWLAAYGAGETPNPCLVCNPAIKYGALMKWAIQQGADLFATGHYARLTRDENGRIHLLQGLNVRKDQAYVLCRLEEYQLQRLILPLGGFSSKHQVRALAKSRGLPVHQKKDSTGICFIAEGDHLTYLARHAPQAMTPGPVRDDTGKIVGRHQGLARYTIGQKKGVGQWAPGMVVVRMDAKANSLWLGPESALWTRTVPIRDLKWMSPVNQKTDLWVKLCQWGPKAKVLDLTDREIRLGQETRAPAPGQVAAIYCGNEIVGSAWITG
jgi:tRNA-specific 2-thiouridylase